MLGFRTNSIAFGSLEKLNLYKRMATLPLSDELLFCLENVERKPKLRTWEVASNGRALDPSMFSGLCHPMTTTPPVWCKTSRSEGSPEVAETVFHVRTSGERDLQWWDASLAYWGVAGSTNSMCTTWLTSMLPQVWAGPRATQRRFTSCIRPGLERETHLLALR